jgi:hypothetical protein
MVKNVAVSAAEVWIGANALKEAGTTFGFSA